MSRYIDADRALRMIRNSKRDCPLVDDKKGIWNVAHDCAISCVEATPTADVVEVVRCKDCKHYDDGECRYYSEPKEWRSYERWTVDVNENDYCSYGERREE